MFEIFRTQRQRRTPYPGPWPALLPDVSSLFRLYPDQSIPVGRASTEKRRNASREGRRRRVFALSRQVPAE